jgi:hypothetical protein
MSVSLAGINRVLMKVGLVLILHCPDVGFGHRLELMSYGRYLVRCEAQAREI